MCRLDALDKPAARIAAYQRRNSRPQGLVADLAQPLQFLDQMLNRLDDRFALLGMESLERVQGGAVQRLPATAHRPGNPLAEYLIEAMDALRPTTAVLVPPPPDLLDQQRSGHRWPAHAGHFRGRQHLRGLGESGARLA